MAKILFATFGSYGDLHPYISVGLELRARGHKVTIATHAAYRNKITFERLGFHPVRPDISTHDAAASRPLLSPRQGADWVFRFMSSNIRQSYEDTLEAAGQADVIVTHPVAYAGVLVAQKLRMPWVSTVLSPVSFSFTDEPGILRGIFAVGERRALRRFMDFRNELDLGRSGHPVFEGQHSPSLALAMFSRCLGEPESDWPAQSVITGFALHDREPKYRHLSRALEAFLDDGPPPIVFTLGSFSVREPGDFYLESLRAIERLGARAVLLVGSLPARLPKVLPAGVFVCPYAPYSALFPRSSVVAHHGGVGTMAHALRAGRPMLVEPRGFDAPDNAARAHRLGVSETLCCSRYKAQNIEPLLRRLLDTPSYSEAAAAVGRKVREENGAVAAADAIEGFLRRG